MDNITFDSQRIAEGYAKRPWLHKEVIKQIRRDCNIEQLKNGLDVGCGAGLSTKALRLLCEHVTGTDISSEMIAVCKKIYKDSSYTFYVSKAEENKIPLIPYRKEDVWKQNDLTDAFKIENKVGYDLKYEFSLDDFIDFMMIQSNVNEQIEKGFLSVEEIRNWMVSTLQPIFGGQNKTLIFEGYNWYIRKR